MEVVLSKMRDGTIMRQSGDYILVQSQVSRDCVAQQQGYWNSTAPLPQQPKNAIPGQRGRAQRQYGTHAPSAYGDGSNVQQQNGDKKIAGFHRPIVPGQQAVCGTPHHQGQKKPR
ncbi:MAG: hypothetical protein U1E84_01760 [Rhodoferax sp.]